MSEIKINTTSLEENIAKLKKYKAQLEADSSKYKYISTHGSGESVELIMEIDKYFMSIKASMLTMLTNSITFFENIEGSVVGADEEAAAAIGGSGMDGR